MEFRWIEPFSRTYSVEVSSAIESVRKYVHFRYHREKKASKQKRRKEKKIYMRISDQLKMKFDRRFPLVFPVDASAWMPAIDIVCSPTDLDQINPPWELQRARSTPVSFSDSCRPTCPRTRPILRGVHSASTQRYQDTSTNYPLFPYAKSYGPPSAHVTSPLSAPKSSSHNNER